MKNWIKNRFYRTKPKNKVQIVNNVNPPLFDLLNEYKSGKNKVQNEEDGPSLEVQDVLNVVMLFLANTQGSKVMNPDATWCMYCSCCVCAWIENPIRSLDFCVRDSGMFDKPCLCVETTNKLLMSGLRFVYSLCATALCCDDANDNFCQKTKRDLFFPRIIPYYLYNLRNFLWFVG